MGEGVSSIQAVTPLRVVVVEDVELEAKLLARALADRGFTDVVLAKDATSALAAVKDDLPCVVVTDVELPGESGIELVRKLRARAASPYVYTMVLTGKGSPERMREAFDAGVDDWALKPFRPDELAARIRVAQRIVRLERSLFARAMELEAALRKLDDGAAKQAIARATARESHVPASHLDALVSLLAWEKLSGVLRESLSGFVGTDLAPTATHNPSAAIVGEVFMTDAAHQLELGVAVVVGGTAMKALTMQMLGEDGDAETGCAVVLESANVLMGSVKAALAGSEYDFAAGLPRSPTFADARAAYDAQPVRQRFAFHSGELEVDVWVCLAERRNSRVRGSELREGMVVAEDVHDERGRLLIRGGVRLTETTAGRLAGLLANQQVTVTKAA